MMTEAGKPVEVFLILGSWSNVVGLGYYPFDLPEEATVCADTAYCNYGIEDVLDKASIVFKPLRRKNNKCRYEPWEVYFHHHYRR